MVPGLICEIFRSGKRQEMYLYVDKAKGMAAVPEALLQQLGKLEPVMTLRLHAGRPLARADVLKVMEAIETQGFYLQLPPVDVVSES